MLESIYSSCIVKLSWEEYQSFIHFHGMGDRSFKKKDRTRSSLRNGESTVIYKAYIINHYRQVCNYAIQNLDRHSR